MNHKIVALKNHASALGEAIGDSMEKALEKLLADIADKHGCHYLTSGVRRTKSGRKPKKLLMSDNFGNEYNIDGVLANQSMQPLIIFESKYIRYKKHNRDKGSWICNAHSAIRRRYHSIRGSIAVLAGSWSGSSLAMMRSNDINLFLIPFDHICDILNEFDIDFSWEEADDEKDTRAWESFNELSSQQKGSIGIKMINSIKDNLEELVDNILDDSIDREVSKVLVELISNLGEVKVHEFESVSEALEFLQQEDLKELFLTTDSYSLFEPPPTFDD